MWATSTLCTTPANEFFLADRTNSSDGSAHVGSHDAPDHPSRDEPHAARLRLGVWEMVISLEVSRSADGAWTIKIHGVVGLLALWKWLNP